MAPLHPLVDLELLVLCVVEERSGWGAVLCAAATGRDDTHRQHLRQDQWAAAVGRQFLAAFRATDRSEWYLDHKRSNVKCPMLTDTRAHRGSGLRARRGSLK